MLLRLAPGFDSLLAGGHGRILDDGGVSWGRSVYPPIGLLLAVNDLLLLLFPVFGNLQLFLGLHHDKVPAAVENLAQVRIGLLYIRHIIRGRALNNTYRVSQQVFCVCSWIICGASLIMSGNCIVDRLSTKYIYEYYRIFRLWRNAQWHYLPIHNLLGRAFAGCAGESSFAGRWHIRCYQGCDVVTANSRVFGSDTGNCHL